jgi:hypothetical protein
MALRHVTKMKLVPEEVYNKLMTSAKQVTSSPQEVTSSDKVNEMVTSSRKVMSRNVTSSRPRKRKSRSVHGRSKKRKLLEHSDPLKEAEQRLEAAVNAPGVPADAKRIHVQQEFKRVQQMKQLQEAKPTLVKMKEESDGSKLPHLSTMGELIRGKTGILKPGRVLDIPPRSPEKRLPLSGDEEREANEILSYIEQNKARLGVSDTNAILQLTKRNKDAVRGSHVRRNVEYEVYKGFRNPQSPKPTGHATFLKNIRNDPFLSSRFQTGSGRRRVAEMEKKRFKARKKALVSRLLKPVKFKPSLW